MYICRNIWTDHCHRFHSRAVFISELLGGKIFPKFSDSAENTETCDNYNKYKSLPSKSKFASSPQYCCPRINTAQE